MKYMIETIDHSRQRYPTVGDYYDDKDLDCKEIKIIRVSRMKNPDYELLIAVHELIESYLVAKAGISLDEIDKFDLKFEEERAQGLHSDTAEPGDDPGAPYRSQHQIATLIEKVLARSLDIDWGEYSSEVDSL